jgi:serine/threonine protein kinase
LATTPEARYDGFAADIWSLGVVLYCSIVGRFPFAKVSEILTSPVVCTGIDDAPCVDLLTMTFAKDKKQRATLPHIMAHPWLREHSRSLGQVEPSIIVGEDTFATPTKRLRTDGSLASCDDVKLLNPPAVQLTVAHRVINQDNSKRHQAHDTDTNARAQRKPHPRPNTKTTTAHQDNNCPPSHPSNNEQWILLSWRCGVGIRCLSASPFVCCQYRYRQKTQQPNTTAPAKNATLACQSWQALHIVL